MIWVFVNYLLHVAVFGAVISVATATLLIKITSNSVERAKVTNLGGLLGQISNLIVSAYGVPVLMYFGGYEKGYFGLSLIFCSIGFILPFLTGIICRETPEVWAEAAQQLSAARKAPLLARQNPAEVCLWLQIRPPAVWYVPHLQLCRDDFRLYGHLLPA